MSRVVVSIFAAIVAIASTRALLKASIPRAPMTRPNYRGVHVAAGMGIFLLMGVCGGLASIGTAAAFWRRNPDLVAASLATLPLLALALGFGLLGLFDDLTQDTERGFAGHIKALRRRTVTGGALKLLGGVAISIAVATPFSGNVGWLLVNALTIALLANVFNAFDLRPGRSVKFFIVGALPLAFISVAAGPAAAASVGAAVTFLPEDLGERAMLGDAGSNALGALLGGFVVLTPSPDWLRLALALLLVILTVLAERPGFSSIIEKTPGLNRFDRFGRI